jgi:transaldolase
MLQQAVRFQQLAPNIQVKMPATKAGIQAYEEATYQGVSINAPSVLPFPRPWLWPRRWKEA